MGGSIRRGRWAAPLLLACLLAVGCTGVQLVDEVEPCTADRTDTCLRPDTTCAYDSFDCNPAIADVVGQLRAVPARGSALGFHRGVMPAPSRLRHWQSIQRLPGAFSNMLLVSRSTSRPADPDVGIVQLASRVSDGHALGGSRTPNASPPDGDRVITEIYARSAHTHAGGTQLLGKILAVPLEEHAAGSRVELYDLSEPVHPRSIGAIEHVARDGASAQAGTASLARLEDGTFLLVIGRRDARVLDFYRSTTADIRATSWVIHDTWRADELRTEIDDTNWGDYQNLNLIAGSDGALYLLGMHEEGLVFRSQWADLFVVRGGAELELTKIAKRRLECQRGCNLDAGGGSYIDPQGRLILYGVEYANTGPASPGDPDGTVRLMEF